MLTTKFLLQMMASVMAILWPSHVGTSWTTQNIEVACYDTWVENGEISVSMRVG